MIERLKHTGVTLTAGTLLAVGGLSLTGCTGGELPNPYPTIETQEPVMPDVAEPLPPDISDILIHPSVSQETIIVNNATRGIVVGAICLARHVDMERYDRDTFTSNAVAAGKDGQAGTSDDMPEVTVGRDIGQNIISFSVGDPQHTATMEVIVDFDDQAPVFNEGPVELGTMLAAGEQAMDGKKTSSAWASYHGHRVGLERNPEDIANGITTWQIYDQTHGVYEAITLNNKDWLNRWADHARKVNEQIAANVPEASRECLQGGAK